METQKHCENCKYFNFYYIRSKHGYYKIRHGLCTERTLSKRDDPYEFVCEKWKSAEIREQEIKDSMKSQLNRMARDLHKIAVVVNDGKFF